MDRACHARARARRALVAAGAALGLLLVGGAPAAGAQQPQVLIYSGTVGDRSDDAIDAAADSLTTALDTAGIGWRWEDCEGAGNDPGECRHPEANPAVFAAAELSGYDAIVLVNAGGGEAAQLWDASEREAIREFVNAGGGIAAVGDATGVPGGGMAWDWWDGDGDSALGTTASGRAPADPPQLATVHVADRNHPSTRGLSDRLEHADEHTGFVRSVRGTHHVLAALDVTSFDLGAATMGDDHPVSWCRAYDGGRIWATSIGRSAAAYEDASGPELIEHLVGGIAWVAGAEGGRGDCGATVWSNFRRTVLSTEVSGPIGLDVAADGSVYWTEIGPVGIGSSGRLVRWDPDSGEAATVVEIQTRTDPMPGSEEGVLGMALAPDFTESRHVYIYYSPRGEWPSGAWMALGHNRLSRFTLNPAGDAALSEQPILDVPKVRVGPSGDGSGNPGSPSWSAHTGGAGLDFDSAGNLYLAIGDDVNPFGQGQNGYSPLDQRYPERYDARNTSANTNDLRGKVLRIRPLAEIEPEAEPNEGATYEIPEGNMFDGSEGGGGLTRREIYAMGFRNPFTLHADPGEPGTIVVGDYGPDAGGDSGGRGPAGIIEWHHITEPGFFGWPFCSGDVAEAHSYNRYTFPSGPSGERFDCSADAIPNESDHNTGLDEVPGPAEPADVWHKRDGRHPAKFGLPTQGSPQEPITGPVYRFDPELPSGVRWPEYYDGSWLILDRNQNWWREVKLRDDPGDGILRANGFFQPNRFGSPPHTFVIPVGFGPDGALYLARWLTAGRDLRPAQLMRIDYVADDSDEEAPEVEAEVEGFRNDAGELVNRATVRLSATDHGGSGVARIEHSLNGGDWVVADNESVGDQFTTSVTIDEPGEHELAYRAADHAGNVSDVESVALTVVFDPGCGFARSDEFEVPELDRERWTVRVDEPGYDVSVADGRLVVPVLDEVDGQRTGPLAFVSQQVPDGDWTVTTRVTIEHETSWQQAGLKLWQSDGNFVKAGFTMNPQGGRFFELTSDDPFNERQVGSAQSVGPGFPSTAWIRLHRRGGQVGVDYAPDAGGEPGQWTTIPETRPVATDPPREGPRVMVGPYTGGDIDGAFANTAAFDFVRFEPDEVVCPDAGPPDPPAGHRIDASDVPDFGVWSPDRLEIDLAEEVSWHFDGPEQGGSASVAHNLFLVAPGDDPATDAFRVGPAVIAPGDDPVSHTLDDSGAWSFFCSLHAAWDGDGWTGTMHGRIDVGEPPGGTDTTPPVTTHTLVPTEPGDGGTYETMVRVVLVASDPGENASGVAETLYRVTLDGVEAEWQTYNSFDSPTFEDDGDYLVEYYSVDNAGNAEEVRSVSFAIDSGVEVDPRPQLRLSVNPNRHWVGPNRRQVRYVFRARNVGEAPTAPMWLCARGPARRVTILGNRCVQRQIPADAQRQRPVRVRISPPARGNVTRIRLIARGPNVENQQINARLRVNR